ncbi:MAG: MMPL family transporter [Pseudomonadota bacterium]
MSTEATRARGVRLRFFIWLALMLAICGAFFTDLKGNLSTETDILALLPGAQHDPVVDHALREFSDQAGRKVLILVGSRNAEDARAAGATFAADLKAGEGIADVQYEVRNRIGETLKAYLAYRHSLLSARDRERLATNQSEALYRDAQRALYTPAGLMRPATPAEDPLGLLSDFLMAQVPPLGKVQLDGGVLSVAGEGKHWVLVIAETRDGPFASTTQETVMPVIEAATEKVRAMGADVLVSGLLPHAAYAAKRAHHEVATFGLVSLIGTILLLLFVHRSMRPVLMSAGSIALGLMAALIACHWIFGRVHLLTLVFGSSLIGVAADYSTYFLTDAFRVPRRWDGRDAVRHVAPGVLLGLGTALTAYAALMAAPFPGLRQIAVFSAVGLTVACGCVLCLFPMMRPPQAPDLSPGIEKILRALLPQPIRKGGMLILLLIVLVATFGLMRLTVVNDLHLMQATPPQLVDSERRVRALMNNPTESQFFLITGNSEEEVLQQEEAFLPKLDALQTQGAISSYAAVTRALPSQKAQAENAALLLRTAYAPDGLLQRMLTELGYEPAQVAARLTEARAGAGARLTAQGWLASGASDSYRHLWLGKISDRYASVVTLGGIRDIAALRSIKQADVRLVDKVGDISELLARYQRITLWIVVLGYVGVLLLFSLRYGFSSALRVVLSPALASVGTLGIFGLIGEALNLFSTFSLLLVLGIGIDYAIFLREGRVSPLSSMIAVLVCAATALLSFGMLAFSSTPFIHSFGLTMLIGITLAVVVAQILAQPADVVSHGELRND